MFDWNQTHINTELSAENSGLIPLNHYKLIRIEGDQAAAFLQGQCTCDFEHLNIGEFTYGAHCNAKGRMHSNFVAYRSDENTFLLRMHHSIIHTALAAFKKYAVFFKVNLAIAESIQAFGVIGSNLEDKLSTLPNTFAPLCTLRLSQARAEVWLIGEQTPTTTSLITEGAHLWQMATLDDGIAELTEELVEQLIPQELNMQLTGGISFAKGCYTGQEIIARLHYKAELKKHMYLGFVTSTIPVHPADELSNNGKRCGKVINSLTVSANEQRFLAICEDSAYSSQNTHLTEDSNAFIQWKPLPYAIT